MSLLDMGAWSTDFMGYPDAVFEQERNDKLLRFIRYALHENAGILALAVAIENHNTDIFEVLKVFCNVKTNKTHRRIRKNCVTINGFKLKELIREKGFTQKEFAELTGVSAKTIINIVTQEHTRRRKSFVNKCEEVLGLQNGELYENLEQ